MFRSPYACDGCDARTPGLLSCIHTFAPRQRTSTIVARDPREEAREATTVLDSLISPDSK